MPNVPQYVIAVIAISKLGATGSGVSPLLAPQEFANQVRDAGIKVLMSLDGLAKPTLEPLDTIPACLETVIVTGADDHRQPAKLEMPLVDALSCLSYLEITADSSPDFHQVDLPPDHICLIQYTGGTTGKPKGAMLTLGGFMYNIPISAPYRPWDVGEETAINALPPSHVGGLAQLCRALRYGARCVLIPDARDIEHYCKQMLKFPPTRLAAVPTLYQMIADHPLSAEIDFSGVKNAQSGGAPITGDNRRRVEAMLNGIVLSDSFGMTESGPTILVNPPDRCKPESIGIPAPGVDVRIVDLETGTQEMPPGEAGEIIASSRCLMAGYLNQPEETANALRQWRGKTWMFTGDVGVMDEEGYVYIKDRAKDMLIVGGFKVFSVEVEDKLSKLDFIASSAVIGSPDANRQGSEIVHLYVEVTPESKRLDPDQLRTEILEFCQAELAPYKVPKVIHLIEAIPLTAVGKIDKKVLREASR